MSASDIDMVGYVVSVSQEIPGVSEGMAFSFNGKTLFVRDEGGLPQEIFNSGLNNLLLRQEIKADAIVVGRDFPGLGNVNFHVAGSVAIDGACLALPVCCYWSLAGGLSLSDVSMVRFRGKCIDSFYPRKVNVIKGDGSLLIPSSESTAISGGNASIDGHSAEFTLASGWEGNPNLHLEFSSFLSVVVDGLNLDSLERLYGAVLDALRFCLGRFNAQCEVSLYTHGAKAHKYVGEFGVGCNDAVISDERDASYVRCIHAKTIETHFASLVQAFLDHKIGAAAFASSRADSYNLSDSKVIELTSYFENLFEDCYPDGVDHSARSLKKRQAVVDALETAKQDLKSGEAREIDRCIRIITQDNLQSRIRFAGSRIDSRLIENCCFGLNIKPDDAELGYKIQAKRNSIAHGSSSQLSLEDVADEYHFLLRLVRAIELAKADFDTETIAKMLVLI